MKLFSIYRIFNKTNGKSYIGYTGNQHVACYTDAHFKRAMRGEGPSKVLYIAIRKHGREAFQVEIIATANTQTKAQKLERLYISRFKTRVIQHGYNMTEGGDGGDTSSSPRYREGIRQRKLPTGPDHHNWGGMSDQAKRNMSLAKKGKQPANIAVWTKAAKGMILVHRENDEREYRIKPEELASYLDQGFKRGRPVKPCPVCGVMANRVTLVRHHKHIKDASTTLRS